MDDFWVGQGRKGGEGRQGQSNCFVALFRCRFSVKKKIVCKAERTNIGRGRQLNHRVSEDNCFHILLATVLLFKDYLFQVTLLKNILLYATTKAHCLGNFLPSPLWVLLYQVLVRYRTTTHTGGGIGGREVT